MEKFEILCMWIVEQSENASLLQATITILLVMYFYLWFSDLLVRLQMGKTLNPKKRWESGILKTQNSPGGELKWELEKWRGDVLHT